MKTIQIPDELYTKIQVRIGNTSFKSVDDYIVKKLQIEFPPEQAYTEEEERLIKERLRKLGYIE